jgi:hypothetical protein
MARRGGRSDWAPRRRTFKKGSTNWRAKPKKESSEMAKFDSDEMDNKIDVSGSMFFNERNAHMKRDERSATHDGSPGGPNAFEGQGSDAGHRKGAGARHQRTMPPTVG